MSWHSIFSSVHRLSIDLQLCNLISVFTPHPFKPCHPQIMDGLSAASSVIAVIQVSSQIFDLCRTYYLNVKDARKDIEQLRNEITALQDALVNVVDLADSSNSSSLKSIDLISQEGGPVEQCHLELTALALRLDPGGQKSEMRAFGLRALKWPFTSKEIGKVMASIGRHKSTFILALTTDQTWVSRFWPQPYLLTHVDASAESYLCLLHKAYLILHINWTPKS